MQLQGIHHVTAITADAQRNVDFYAGVLGLRLVKRTVNFDAPDMYHLYFGDELGAPGSIMTFFEARGAARGRAGAGMIHRVVWRVASEASLDHWQGRLDDRGLATSREEGSLRFADPEGLGIELVVDRSGEAPLVAGSDVPAEHALLGFAGVRAHARVPERSDELLAGALGLAREGDGWRVAGADRSALYAYDPPPEHGAVPGAGTVHHVAWASPGADHLAWQARVAEAGFSPTPVLDRTYFRSIYFREPSGVLFEIATLDPGFAVDERADALGEELRLPAQYGHLRPQLERLLVPLEAPRSAGA